MSVVKPYTFVAGTKARANEVNENFDRLYSQVNSNISEIATNATKIANLKLDKADVQGSSQQRFAVADATANYDAVNKQTAMKYISNSVDVISGLTITTDSGSPEDTIIVDVGACYDSEREVVMQLTASISKLNDDQLGNANYYVYLIADNNGNNPDVMISTSSITPSLPSGYTKYRKIGYFKTDSSGNISEIYSFGYNSELPSGIANVISSYHNGDSGYIVYSNGFKIQWGSIYHSGADNTSTIYFLVPWSTSNYSCGAIWSANANVGDKKFNYSLTGRNTTYMTIRSQAESFQQQGRTIYWICTGF